MSAGYVVTSALGRVTTAEIDSMWAPRTTRAGTACVVLVHGSGAPTEFIDSVAQPSSVNLAAFLALHGIPCVAVELGGNQWGNDLVMSGIDSAWAAIKAACPAARTDKLSLLGVSMGGAGVARYTQLHPTRVAAAVGLIPAYDVRYEYENIPAVQAAIGAAWGVTYPTPLPSAADLAASASAAAGVPLLTGYSTADTTVPPAPVLAYTTAVGGTAIITDTTAGHSDAAVGGMPPATVAQFLIAHGG